MTGSPKRVHLGRYTLRLPPDAKLTDFSASIGEFELEVVDLGGDSLEAGYLGWAQVSESLREAAGFAEHESGNRWHAIDPANARLLMLAQAGESGLVLRGPDGQLAFAESLAAAFTASDGRSGFGVVAGRVDLPPGSDEEFTATFQARGGWELTLSVAPVSAPAPTDFGQLADALRAMHDPGSRAVVRADEVGSGNLAGESLFVEADGTYVGVWRCPGVAGDPAAPEVELEFEIRESDPDVAYAAWRAVLDSLDLAERSGAA